MSNIYALPPPKTNVAPPYDPSTLLHRKGVFNRPSNNPMNHYSTSYSTSHDFKHADQPDAQLREPIITSGFTSNTRPSTVSTGSVGVNRRLGQEMDARERNTSEAARVSRYTEFYDEQIQKAKVHPLDIKDTINFTTKLTGYSRNSMATSPRAQVAQYVSSNSLSYRPPPDAVAREFPDTNFFQNKSANGFIKNNSHPGMYGLDEGEAREWMTTTYNTKHGPQPDIVIPKKRNEEERNGSRITGFSHSILQAGAAGIGSDHAKLGTTQADREGRNGVKYGCHEPSRYNQGHAIMLLEREKQKDPMYYQHLLDGEPEFQTTYNLTHQDPGTQTSRKEYGERLRAGRTFHQPNSQFRNAGQSRPSTTGSLYGKTLTGPWATTSHRVSEHAAIRARQVLETPPTIDPAWQDSGFTVNFRVPKNGQAQMTRGELIATEQRSHLQSSHVYGDQALLPTNFGPTAVPVVNSNHTSAFNRDSLNPPIFEVHTRGNIRNDQVHPTVGRIFDVSKKIVDKNYGGEVHQHQSHISA